MDVNEVSKEGIRTPLLMNGPNVMTPTPAETGSGGGTKRAREEEEKKQGPRKRARRAQVINQCAVNKNELKWNIRIFRKCPFVGNAASQLSTLTLTGGARITIGDLVDLRDYTASTEAYLMEQLGHALHWIMIAGFIPFCLEPHREVLEERVEGNREVLFDVLEPQMIGSFERYFNPMTRRVEMRFIKDWKTREGEEREEDEEEEEDDPASQWYVYCVTAPDESGSVISPLSQIRPEYMALELVYKPADVDGTILATHPIPVDEELPKQRGTLVDEDEMGRRRLADIGSGAASSSGGIASPPGFPRLPPGMPRLPEMQYASQEYMPNRVEAERMRRGTGMVDETGAYHVMPGRKHSGILIPHASTSISQRVTDYIRYVSSALRVPHHLIDPLRNASTKTGSSASSRHHHKASVSKAANTPGGGSGAGSASSQSGSNYNADPLFVPALQYRMILCDFVKTVLALKHGREAGNIIGRLKTNTSEELALENKLVAELEESIKKARVAVVNYDPNAKPEEEEKEKKKPAAVDALPPIVAPEVEELTRRLESIKANTQLLSDAVQKLSSIKDQRSPFRLRWHQPFITDTSNLTAIAQQLSMPPEEASSMFRQRLGLI